jgi:dTDP-glucose 4,6-dehydratase
MAMTTRRIIMQTLLVTGAAGFLGSYVVQQRARNHPQDRMILLDNFSHGSHPSQMMSLADQDRIISIVGDVRDGALVSDLIRSHEVTRILHCAALDIAGCQNLDAATIMDNNVSGTLMMLEAAKLVWSQKTLRDTHFHYVSCADGLPPNAQGLITDDENGAPESLYAASKLNAENLVLGFAHRYQMNASVSRPTSIYGPRQFPGTSVAASIIAILEGRRLPIYGAGSQNINMLHVDDAARGLNLALEATTSIGRFGLAGDTVTMRDLIGLICRSIDEYAARNKIFAHAFSRSPAASNLPSSTLISMVQDRRQDIRARAYLFNRARHQLGFSPREKLQTAIAHTVHWYIENANWWRSIREGQHQTRADLAMVG